MLDRSQLVGKSNYDPKEIAQFDKMAKEWWDPIGKFKTVLAFNEARSAFIHRQINQHFSITENEFSQLKVLDIGCGGGLLSEPLARKGAWVSGIDASSTSIEVAKAHARQSGLSISYRHMLSSDLTDEEQFDVVLNTEVIEHVPDQQQLVDECCALLKPNGLLVMATLNRTFMSYLFGIVGAEYVLRLLPVGTHSWSKFVKPQEMSSMVAENGLSLCASVGLKFQPFSKTWKESGSLSINYLMAYSRSKEKHEDL
jgi:2-polyprenyl-6-hydroxyphenyl methylase/3-demethylubiquinone-9 3-methyltransferase